MRKYILAEFFGFSIFCLPFIALTADCAETVSGRANFRLENCRAQMEKQPEKASNCFSNIRAKGGPRESRIAAFYLSLIADNKHNSAPTVNAVSKIVKKAAARRVARSRSRSRYSRAGVKAAVPGGAGKTFQARKRFARRRLPRRSDKGVIETISTGKPPRVTARRSEIAGKPGLSALKEVARYEVTEAPSKLNAQAVASKRAGVVIPRVAYQELDENPKSVVIDYAEEDAPPVQPKVVTDVVGPNEPTYVVISTINPSKFSIEDALAPGTLEKERIEEVHFDKDNSEIGSGAMAVIRKASALSSGSGTRLIVRGSASPEEKDPENLSKLRAQAVARFAEKKFKFSPSKITVEWGVGIDQEDQRVLLVVGTESPSHPTGDLP